MKKYTGQKTPRQHRIIHTLSFLRTVCYLLSLGCLLFTNTLLLITQKLFHHSL